jgi:methionyl-tRNA formyltransferase
VKIVFLTTDDPLYLPAFFDRVLAAHATNTAAVYVVPPLYKDQTALQAMTRYFRTFGAGAALRLAAHVLAAKVARRSVAHACRRHGVRAAKASDVNSDSFLDELDTIAPDVIVSVSCPQIFRSRLIELPPKGLLNVHGALLPEYRGVMPSFWMLANGETRAGVSIYFVNEQIDAGDLCVQRAFDVLPDESLDGFLHRSKQLAADMLLEALDSIERGTVVRTPLDLSAGSYYSWPDAEAVRRFRMRGRKLW